MKLNCEETVWAFDLGKGSIGEAVRQGTRFLHKESLLIPAELARRGPATVSGTPASRYRAMKTRQAHRKREEWLEKVWKAAGLTPLQARKPEYVGYQLRRKKKRVRGKSKWKNVKVGGRWILPPSGKADYRLEREFAPKQIEREGGQLVEVKYPEGKAADGAPAATAEDFGTCYTSCLLRIKLLEWKEGERKLAEWQIYKALRAALQRRGYGRVPWATKEARKQGKSAEELEAEEEKKLQQADPRYREAVDKWKQFKSEVPAEFQLPCYYDALHMGLWRYVPEQQQGHLGYWNPENEPAKPPHGSYRTDHKAESTRNIRSDRTAVRAELTRLGDQAAAMLPKLRDAFARWQREGWKFAHPFQEGKQLTYPIHAKSFGEFLCDGPAGQPVERSFEAFLKQRREAGVRRGSFEEWMAGLGQKTPSFDNRILNGCVLIPRYHVCKVDVRLETDGDGKPTGRLVPESLLASEVTLLLKLKNLLVADAKAGQRKLTVQEVRSVFDFAQRRLRSLALLTPEGELVKEWPQKVADRFAINKSHWQAIAAESELLARVRALTVTSKGAAQPLSTEDAELLLRAVATSKKGASVELPEPMKPLLKAAKAEWKKAKDAADQTLLRPMPGHEEVKAPKSSGRSAYSRVALRILKELILSGEAPSVFHDRLMRRDTELLQRLGPSPGKLLVIFNDSTAADEDQRKQEDTENRKRGLLVSELGFLRQMRKDNTAEDSWENIFIPSQTLEALQQRHTEDGKLDADAAIGELLGTIKDPIVRHRLEVFNQRLKKLQFGDEEEAIPAFGVPDAVVLEFVREDFMGEEAKRELKDFQSKREAARKTAREEAQKSGSTEKSAPLKYELCNTQGGICLYCGQPFSRARLDEYAIDHIVPLGEQGPDAMVNKVLAHRECNEAKGKQTPFQWWHHNTTGKAPTISWDGYTALVEKYRTTLRNKKVQLLTREDAPELVERYTALAETAWVSKLAQTIANLRFGWKNGTDYSGPKPVKRVIVVSGGLTARVRRKYGLDKLLYTEVTDAEVLAKKVKNRDDKRHHALDAMVLTFIPQWARDPNKEGFFRFPAAFRNAEGREDYQTIRKLFQQHLAEVMPRNIAYERAALADTSFGCRLDGGKPVIVQRVAVLDLGQKPAGAPGKTTFDLIYLVKQIQSVRDATIRRRLEEFAATNPDEPKWKAFCESFAQKREDGTTGARILKVCVNAAAPDEFKDLSKDGEGAWRKAKGDHQGQIIYTDADGNLAVKPVYVHASIRQELTRIVQTGGKSKVHCFVRSKCLFRLRKELPQPDYRLVIKNEQKQKRRVQATAPLAPGTFMLNTIITASMDVEFSSAGNQRVVAPLQALLVAGFETI
jgi:5-methylcytosine-specific restriction endonuclease McrA